ncbi:MAG: hypothetical protein JWM59_4122 [Verrucomicrobiales bacterium]|nr:hypothetical protein [Verrucomicrobiales bacterium]
MTLFSRLDRQSFRSSFKMSVANILGALLTPSSRAFVPAKVGRARGHH